MDILTLLLIALFICFPLGVIVRIPIFESSFVYPIDIVVLVLFIVVLFRLKSRIFKLPLFFPLAAFIAWAFLTLLLNIRNYSLNELIVSFFYLVRFILYSSLLFAFHDAKRFSSLGYRLFLAVSGFWIILLGFVQYAYYPNLKNLYYLGWDEHLFRMFSTLLDPNFAGVLFVLELILLISYFSETMNEWGKQRNITFLFEKILNRRIVTFWVIISIILTITAIFLTYSRGAYLMFLFSIPLYFLLRKKRIAIIVVAVLFVLGVIFVPKNLGGEGLDLSRTASIVSRVDSVENALVIFQSSPIYGIGFNAYRYAQIQRGMLETNVEDTHSGAGASNSYLFALATTGIIGFVIYIFFWFRVLTLLFKKKKESRQNDYFVNAVIASLLGVFLHSLFENTLFYPFVIVWVFTMIGIVSEKPVGD